MWNGLCIILNGETLLLDVSGAAFWPAERTLIFADLHLEKGSSYARGRQFLPPYDTEATLLRMAAAVARFNPKRILFLGDFFTTGRRPNGYRRARGRCWKGSPPNLSGFPAITILIRRPGRAVQ